jgi:hypothetical protein
VADPAEAGAARLGALRASIEHMLGHAALAHLPSREGAPITADMCAPRRNLDATELPLRDEWCAEQAIA